MSEFKYIFKNRNAKLIIPDSGKFRSTRKPGGVQLTGVDYIPPMNAITLNPSSIGLRSFRGIADVPVEARDNFSWINPEHIRQYKSELNLPADIMSPIYNQAKCGSCWAVAVAQAFSDRWAIANKTSNPKFSPTFLLSCTMKYQQETSPFKELFPNKTDWLPMQGCNGGMPADAVDFIQREGISLDKCWNYDWCLTSDNCITTSSRGEGADINELIPKCEEYNSCVNVTNGRETKSTSDKIYKSKKWNDVKQYPIPDFYFQSIDDTNPTKKIVTSIGSAKTFAPKDDKFGNQTAALGVIDEIKEEIYKRGPVVACFDIIYSSFFDDADYYPKFFSGGGGWIDDIYVHANDDQLEKLYDDSCVGKNDLGCQIGGHAVVIVGWGKQRLNFNKIPNFLKPTFNINNFSETEQKLFNRLKPIYENLKNKEISYWIVRNSWGSHNIPNHQNGYFKMAMTDFDLKINRYPCLDVPKKKYGYLFGGVTAMLPELSADKFDSTLAKSDGKLITQGLEYGESHDGVDPSILKPVYESSNANSGGDETSFFKKYRWILIPSVIALILILFFVLGKK